MISIKSSGDFDKTIRFLDKFQNGINLSGLDEYGQMGVSALESATPVDTHLTANSWYYQIIERKNSVSISWHNRNEDETGTPIVILLRFGHGTRGGTYVRGRDFITPAIQPVFDEISRDVWKKVTDG